MKLFLAFCVVLVAGELNAQNVHLSEEQQAKATKYTVECAKESGVKSEVLDEAKKGHYPEDEGLKKFVLCFFKKSDILSPDAKLNVDIAVSKLPAGVDKADATKVLEECKDKTGKDDADTAFAIFKCYHQGIKTHVLF